LRPARCTSRRLFLDLRRLDDALDQEDLVRAVHVALDRISREWAVPL
jgi:hypothetical protein